ASLRLRCSTLLYDPNLQPLPQLFQRLRPVTNLILHLLSEFRKGLLIPHRHEKWIITKPSRSPRRFRNPSFARSFKQPNPQSAIRNRSLPLLLDRGEGRGEESICV